MTNTTAGLAGSLTEDLVFDLLGRLLIKVTREGLVKN